MCELRGSIYKSNKKKHSYIHIFENLPEDFLLINYSFLYKRQLTRKLNAA